MKKENWQLYRVTQHLHRLGGPARNKVENICNEIARWDAYKADLAELDAILDAIRDKLNPQAKKEIWEEYLKWR